MSGERDSTLIIAVERELHPGSEEYMSREMRAYSTHSNKPSEVSFQKGYNLALKNLGGAIAIVLVYRQGMHDDLRVDTVIEVDGGPVFDRPLVITHSGTTTVLTGQPGEDEYFRQDGMSLESVTASPGPQVQTIQTGFTPGQKVVYMLGQTLDKRGVRLVITDMRLKSPVEIPSSEPLSRA